MSYSVFSYDNYHALLSGAKRAGRTITTVSDYLHGGHARSAADLLVLRHDVDRWTAQAVRMAEFEHSLGIRATYYFRSDRRGRFPTTPIERIHALGHECGYHYETLSHLGGDRGRALAAFETNLAHFRKIVPCSTVSAHGAPLSRHDNLSLLTTEDPARFGLIGDAVHSFRGVQVLYFTDSGGAWNASSRRNLRDRFFDQADHGLPLPTLGNGFERVLIDSASLVYLTTHPERWASNAGLALVCSTRDLIGLCVKAVTSAFWRLRGGQETSSQ